MSASATAPYPCGEYPVALLDLPAPVKKELVAYRAARDRQQHSAAIKAIEQAFAAADAARCRTSPHFAAVLVAGSEPPAMNHAHMRQYRNEALDMLRGAAPLPPILQSVYSHALVSRCEELVIMGRHSEAIADSQQAAALAVTPWDEVHAYGRLAGLLGEMTGEQGMQLQREAAAKLETAVAACEEAGVPSTDKVLRAGTEIVWSAKFERASSEGNHAAALVCVRKLRALQKQEGHPQRNNPIHALAFLGFEAQALVQVGRVEEAMELLGSAPHLIRSATVEGAMTMMQSIKPCVDACVLARKPALAHSFLRMSEDFVSGMKRALQGAQRPPAATGCSGVTIS